MDNFLEGEFKKEVAKGQVELTNFKDAHSMQLDEHGKVRHPH